MGSGEEPLRRVFLPPECAGGKTLSAAHLASIRGLSRIACVRKMSGYVRMRCAKSAVAYESWSRIVRKRNFCAWRSCVSGHFAQTEGVRLYTRDEPGARMRAATSSRRGSCVFSHARPGSALISHRGTMAVHAAAPFPIAGALAASFSHRGADEVKRGPCEGKSTQFRPRPREKRRARTASYSAARPYQA